MAARTLAQIERRIEKTKTVLSGIGEMRPGTLTQQFKDPQNQTGTYYQLSDTLDLMSRTDYISNDAVADARQQVANYKRFKELCAQWVALSIEHSKLKIKLRRKFIATLATGLTVLAMSPLVHAADITLKLATLPNGNHKYYHNLLVESLKAAGHTVKIVTLDNIPQPRIVAYIDSGNLTLHWFLQTKERDEKWVPVTHKLTQGLIGKRIMLIPKGEEGVYAKVSSLDDLKATGKVAGLGKGWFDVGVWNESGLKVWEQAGDWKQLYPMIAVKNRGIDYFPRGANEIAVEAKDNPNLAIEPRLLLIYPRDFSFYLSKPNAALKPVIEAALVQAEKAGLQKKLIDEYFGPSVTTLGLDKRVVINLKNPTTN